MAMDLSRSAKQILMGTIIISLFIFYVPQPALSQQGDGAAAIQDLLVNGGFEGGFQEEYGLGYGWGGFSNGNAVVGWNFDEAEAIVGSGNYAQRIEITEALNQDRYAGIYQTISVVPGQQYKLTLKGLIRSDEGSIEQSDYGHRLQYAIDQDGGTAWELVDEASWQELPWDEQPLELAAGESYRIDAYNTTITAQSDQLTLFIRGWKKWTNNGTAVFNIDDVQFVGPAPEGFQAPVAQAAAVSNGDLQAVSEAEVGPAIDPEPAQAAGQSLAIQNDETGASVQPESTTRERVTPLPTTGDGEDGALLYVFLIGVTVLLALFGSAIAATVRRRNGLVK